MPGDRRATTAFAHHWQMMLAAAVVGLVLGVAVVAVSYLAAPVRQRLTASPSERARVLAAEFERLERLGDAAAVIEERGLPGARELREEAGMRGMLRLAPCRARAGGRPREGR